MQSLNIYLFKALLSLVVFIVGTDVAFAARPFLTDDATIVDDCQIESWWQGAKKTKENEFWLMPACNFKGVEWGLGVGRFTQAGETLLDLSIKKEIIPLDEKNWGLTWQLGYEADSKHLSEGHAELNLALTYAFFNEAMLVHTNLGYVRNKYEENQWTQGIAVQWNLTQEQWVFAELYREDDSRPVIQVGYLNEVLPEKLQLDLGIGQRFRSKQAERFISLGFVYYFAWAK